jgi:hypothetical protein
MLFKKESVKPPSYSNELDKAKALAELADTQEASSSPEAMITYAKALDIYDSLFNGPDGDKFARNPDLHREIAFLFWIMDLFLDSDPNADVIDESELLIDRANFHFSQAEIMYKDEGDTSSYGEILGQHAEFLRSCGQNEEAKAIDALARGTQNIIKARKNIKGVAQETEEFYAVTEDQLRDYDSNKAPEKRKKSLPQTLGSIASAFTRIKRS